MCQRKSVRTRSWVVSWLGSEPNPEELAKRLSPVTYVRPGLPPILTIHGKRRPNRALLAGGTLPRSAHQGRRPQSFLTIDSNTHGDFTDEQMLNAYSG